MKSYSKQKIKSLIRRYIWILSILLAIPTTHHAKPASKLRKFLNYLHFNFSMGYGRTSYENQIFKYNVFVKEGNLYLYNPNEGAQVGYLVRWFGQPYVRMHLYESANFLAGLANPTDGKTSSVTFYGAGNTFPITLSGHIDIKKKFRVELGGSIYLHMVDQLIPEAKHKALGPYEDPEGIHYTTKLFLLAGFKLLENPNYSFLLNTQLSYDFVYGNPFKDTSAISSNTWVPLAVGIGLTLEKHISEYLSVFGKIMYEKISLVDKMQKRLSNVISFTRDQVVLQIGVTVNFAEIPRCPIPDCEIEVKHKHADTAYRGASFATGENSLGYKLYEK